ncbi:MAG: TlpA family protein disulfide reductase [Reichenbachiella sp.]
MKYLLIILIVASTDLLAQPFQVGDKVPDIMMQNLKGENIRLSSLEGKIVLLDFWASWCKPCRKENPEIVKMYNKYKDEEFENGDGFTVFSVSMDMNQTTWENAVNKDGLIWETHVCDMKGWKNEAAKRYGVREIPQSYLLNGDGEVVALNPRGDKLEKELKKMNKSSYSFFRFLFNW